MRVQLLSINRFRPYPEKKSIQKYIFLLRLDNIN